MELLASDTVLAFCGFEITMFSCVGRQEQYLLYP